MPNETPDPARSAASAARRPTGDPRRFLIPAESLPAGFVERVESRDWTPVEPRPASTVVLMRDGPDGLEALLLRRHRHSGFAAGAWVFPGGTVDEGDRDPELRDRLDGPSPQAWAERLGVDDPAEALGFVAAALREAYEETGILLARPDPELPVPPAAEEGREIARRALLDGVVGLREVAVNQALRLAGDELIYIAHWITPAPEPRRYDTRFFLAHVPADSVCTPHQAELTDARWMAPGEAVAAFERGEIRLLPPTVATLRRLAPFRTRQEVCDALEEAPVPSILPRMRRHADGVVIEVPEEA